MLHLMRLSSFRLGLALVVALTLLTLTTSVGLSADESMRCGAIHCDPGLDH